MRMKDQVKLSNISHATKGKMKIMADIAVIIALHETDFNIAHLCCNAFHIIIKYTAKM